MTFVNSRDAFVAFGRGPLLKNHCQRSGVEPTAFAVNVRFVPAFTACDCGCVVMLGAVPDGGLVTLNVAEADAEPKSFEICTV